MSKLIGDISILASLGVNGVGVCVSVGVGFDEFGEILRNSEKFIDFTGFC